MPLAQHYTLRLSALEVACAALSAKLSSCFEFVYYCCAVSLYETVICDVIVATDKVSMPDLLGQAVGEQRQELLARLAGNEVGICW